MNQHQRKFQKTGQLTQKQPPEDQQLGVLAVNRGGVGSDGGRGVMDRSDESPMSQQVSERTLPPLLPQKSLAIQTQRQQRQQEQRLYKQQQQQQLDELSQLKLPPIAPGPTGHGKGRLPHYLLAGGIADIHKHQLDMEPPEWLHQLISVLEDMNEEWRNVDRQHQKTRAKCDFLLVDVIGNDALFVGPFGVRKICYFDYVASGRSLRCVEEFIQSSVLPSYGNTHSSGSMVALQTNAYREEARCFIKKCVNAGPEDALIFTGSGSTGAVQTLIGILDLQERRRRGERVSVVYGPFEHHSNILPWRELAQVCVRATSNTQGAVDLAALSVTLQKLRTDGGDDHLLVGAFSAASNVTGVLTDTRAVTALLHSYGAIAVWDFACAAPHMAINVNSSPDAFFDAVLISPHKFVGGPGTPGILVAKRRLFNNRVPHRPGGGTVEYVTKDAHQYERDLEIREEGGTPAIVDCVRCGLAFRVKRDIGDEEIQDREGELLRWFWQVLPDMENVLVLGPGRECARLPVISFLVVNRETGLFLHHNFIAILLNDLYGVQSRAGCACAGPYASDLLQFDSKTLKRYPYLTDGNNRLKYCIDNYPRMKEEQAKQKDGSESSFEDLEVFKPGFVRVNLPFFYTNEMIAFLLEAITMVSRHGWKLLPEYDCDPRTGVWKHSLYTSKLRRLREFKLARSNSGFDEGPSLSLESIVSSARQILMTAEDRFNKRIREGVKIRNPLDATRGVAVVESKIRWFALPHDVVDALNANSAR